MFSMYQARSELTKELRSTKEALGDFYFSYTNKVTDKKQRNALDRFFMKTQSLYVSAVMLITYGGEGAKATAAATKEVAGKAVEKTGEALEKPGAAIESAGAGLREPPTPVTGEK